MTKKSMKIPALVLSLTVLLGACNALDDLLSVDAPSRVVASDLENPAAAGLLVASVANEFRCAFTYYATASALTGNEWRDASNNSVLNIWDQRVHDTSGYGSRYASADCGSNEPAIYQPLSRTRWLPDQTLDLLAGWDVADVPDKAAFQAEVAMYAGFTYTLFAESMCSVAFDEGPEQTPVDALNLAVERFDQSIAAGGRGTSSTPPGSARRGRYSISARRARPLPRPRRCLPASRSSWPTRTTTRTRGTSSGSSTLMMKT